MQFSFAEIQLVSNTVYIQINLFMIRILALTCDDKNGQELRKEGRKCFI